MLYKFRMKHFCWLWDVCSRVIMLWTVQAIAFNVWQHRWAQRNFSRLTSVTKDAVDGSYIIFCHDLLIIGVARIFPAGVHSLFFSKVDDLFSVVAVNIQTNLHSKTLTLHFQ